MSKVAEAIRRRKAGGSKYKAAPAYYRGERYSSKQEAAYAKWLDQEMAAGRISDWVRQVPITLGIAENRMVIDFLVWIPARWHPGEYTEWHEVKGNETQKFKADKRKWERWGRGTLRVVKPVCRYTKQPDGTSVCEIRRIESYVIEGRNERRNLLRENSRGRLAGEGD